MSFKKGSTYVNSQTKERREILGDKTRISGPNQSTKYVSTSGLKK